MKLRNIKQAGRLTGKVVLLRTDFNVAIDSKGRVAKDEIFRLERTIPTIRHLIKERAKVVILTHLGRPAGKFCPNFTNKPLALALGKLLNKPVKMLPGVVEEKIKSSIENLKPGQVVILENLRFYPGEDKNDPKFARQLANLGEIYVNDAFGTIHRSTASLVAITKFLPSFAGLLLQEEVDQLTKLVLQADKPLFVVMGGAKAETKLPVLNKLLPKADKILVGGILANTLLKSRGLSIGGSIYEKSFVSKGKKLINNHKILLPQDVICDDISTLHLESQLKDVAELTSTDSIIDIGLKTALVYAHELRKAKTIFFNGPLGYIEKAAGAHGSQALAEHMAMLTVSKQVKTVVGGGETISLFSKLNLISAVSYVSTGGGALLAWLVDPRQPGLKPLII